MISLDKNILDKNSRVAQRMIEYGKKDELFIIIPDKEKKFLDLSPTAHAQSTGGKFKIVQFINLYLLGKKLIKYSLITTQDPFFTGLVGWLLKRKTKVKLEVQMHGDFYSNSYYKKSGLKNLIQYYIGKWLVLKHADKIRVVGERIKQSLIKLNIGESKIEARPIFIDTEKIKNYQPKIYLHQKYPGYEKIFLVLGRLDPVKNIDWLIEIFREVIKQKNYLLLIVGDGMESHKLKAKSYKLSLGMSSGRMQANIKFETWTNNPISYLKTTDCILFPSLSEGCGLVPMEANATGTSIIMNDVGVANYELKPSERVKILPINDKEKWIQEILNFKN